MLRHFPKQQPNSGVIIFNQNNYHQRLQAMLIRQFYDKLFVLYLNFVARSREFRVARCCTIYLRDKKKILEETAILSVGKFL